MNNEIADSYQFFFDSLYHKSQLNAILLMEASGRIKYVNPAFTEYFGYTCDELAGKNFSILFTAEDKKLDKPQKELTQALTTGQANDKNYLVKKNGEAVWVSGETVLSDAPGELRLLKIFQNISEQKDAEHMINRVSEFNANILSTIDDLVIALDFEMKIVKANPAFYNLLKRTPPENAANNFIDFVKHYDKKGILAKSIDRLINEGEMFTNLLLEVRGAHSIYTFDISARSILLSQNRPGILLVGHDITILKEVEKEREDIIGFVAHELRNPLSNVSLCNEMLQTIIQKKKLTEAGTILQHSQKNISRLNKMIDELYQSTKISAGNFSLDISEFDFDEMIKEAVSTVQQLNPDFNIIVSGKGGMVKADRSRIIQVINNYLSNSIKYSNDNRDIAITICRDKKILTLAVKDEGPGIAAAQLPYIFDRFFRAEKTKDLEGIGLGLFLCRRIINVHHGRVWAESEEGKGSTFYFAIPV